MKKLLYVFIVLIILIIGFLLANIYLSKKDNKTSDNKKEITTTKKEEVKKENIMDGISLNYHASIRIEKAGKVIYFDPYKITDAKNDADYIFITHSHYDHYSEGDIKKVMKDSTKFIVSSDLEDKVKAIGAKDVTVAYPEKKYTIDDMKVEAIPSYNTSKTFHKKSYNWVGYNVEIDNVKYYVVGDSDVTDEMKKVKCDVIFIPVGGTYTMTDSEAANIVNEMKPKYAVPIHYGEVGSKTNAENFINKLNDGIEGKILN